MGAFSILFLLRNELSGILIGKVSDSTRRTAALGHCVRSLGVHD